MTNFVKEDKMISSSSTRFRHCVTELMNLHSLFTAEGEIKRFLSSSRRTVRTKLSVAMVPEDRIDSDSDFRQWGWMRRQRDSLLHWSKQNNCEFEQQWEEKRRWTISLSVAQSYMLLRTKGSRLVTLSKLFSFKLPSTSS